MLDDFPSLTEAVPAIPILYSANTTLLQDNYVAQVFSTPEHPGTSGMMERQN